MQAWKDMAKLPRAVWLLCVAVLINRMGTMAILFLALYLTKHLGFAPATAGLVMGVYGATALVVTPLSGGVSDRFGAVGVVVFSLLGTALVLLVYPFLHNLLAIFAMTFLFAAMAEGFRPAALSVLGSLVPQSQVAATHALYRFSTNLGMSVGPVVGGFLALISYKMIFWVDGATALAAFLFLIFSGFPAQAIQAHHRQKEQHKDLPRRGVLQNKAFVAFLLAGVPLLLVVFQLNSTYPLFVVNDLKYKESVYGLLSLINTAIIVLFEIPLVAHLKAFSIRHLLTFGTFCTALGFGFLALAQSVWILVASMLLITLGEMFQSCSAMTYVNHLATIRQRGAYLGYFRELYT